MSDKIYIPTNRNAQDCVKNVAKYLSDISYSKIVTGQHTQTLAQEKLYHIKKVTGKGLRSYRSFITTTISKTFTAGYNNKRTDTYTREASVLFTSYQNSTTR